MLGTHTNSMLASRQTEKFNRRLMILDAYSQSRTPLTDRQVMRICGFTDMNAIRPRITELIEERLLVEVDSVPDEITGRRVRRAARTGRFEQLEMAF